MSTQLQHDQRSMHPHDGTCAHLAAPDFGESSYIGSQRLKGKRALITGGDSWIGHAVVIAYTREGADVAFLYSLEAHDGDDTSAQLIRDSGQQSAAYAIDLTDQGAASQVVTDMTKAAQASLTEALATELEDQGMRVNAVAPGPMWTPLIPGTGFPEDEIRRLGQDTLLARRGQPVEAAWAYVYLASEEAKYTSGTVIPITAGKTFTGG